MRLDRLDLLAWGSFEQTPLPLNGGEFGLHIVYGPNEAGKSTALRGLLALLFGVLAKNVQDDHRHARGDLRVAADLRDASGKLVRVVRRVGDPRKSLRDGGDKNVVDPFWLQPGEADDEEFRRRLVFGYDDFVAGGRAMLQGGGEVGQTLFSAAAGLGNLSAVRKQLAAESDDLFKPRASKPKLNELLSQLAECRSRLNKLTLKESEFSAKSEELARAGASRQAAEDALAQLELRKRELECRLQALPDLTKRDDLRAELKQLADVPLLADDFSGKRIAVGRDLAVRESAARRLHDECAELERTLAELPIQDPLLSHAESVRHLIKESGKNTKSLNDRTRLVSEAREQENKRELLLAELPSGVVQIKMSRHDRALLRDLDAERTKLRDQRELLSRQQDSEHHTAQKLSAEVAALPAQAPSPRIVLLANQARGAAESEKSLAAHEQKLAAESRAIESALRTLQLDTSWNNLPGVVAPSLEAIEEFQSQLAQCENLLSQTHGQIAQLEAELAGAKAELDRHAAELQPPSAEDLAAARSRRDEIWRLIRLQLSGQSTEQPQLAALLAASGDAADLPAAFEFWQSKADLIADRLYREAGLVATQIALRTQRDKIAAQLEASRSQEVRRQADLAKLLDQWRVLWAPLAIAARSPREMLLWRRQFADAQQRSQSALELSLLCADERRALAELRGQLLDTLASGMLPDEPAASDLQQASCALLAELLAARVNAWSAVAARRLQLSERLSEAEAKSAAAAREVERLEASLAQLEAEWLTLVAPLPASLQGQPKSLFHVLDSLDELGVINQQLAGLRRRIEGIDRDVDDYTKQVRDVVRDAAPDLAGLEPIAAVEALEGRLKQAQKHENRREECAAQLAKLTADRRLEEAEQDRLKSLLQQLCREARCPTPDELDRRVEESNRRRLAERELRDAEDRLRRLAGGTSLDEFARSARELSEAELREALHRLQPEIQTQKDARDAALQLQNSARSELALMNGGGSAAEVEEEAQSQLARIRGLAEQFIRLRIAGAVLEQAIKRHQQENETPILKRAGELFTRLTLGSFSELRTGHNEQGEAILVGLRDENKEVAVEGMSDGARDQLFLSLRLASLELFLSGREPIPFIVDDILINFDDARSIAALQVLAELAHKTQVILFTHHEHLTKLAEANLPRGELFVHRLT
jgi:uncharacterized protein YhaN